jgi:hypothetical protein
VKIFLRILTFTTSTLCFLLSIVSLSAWIRSHYVEDYCEINYKLKPSIGNGKVDARTRRLTIDSTSGLLRISSFESSLGQATIEQARIFPESRIVTWSHIKPHAEPNKWLRTGPEGRLNKLGFYYWRSTQPKQRIILMRVIGFPFWAPTVLFSIPPLLVLTVFILRRGKRLKNLCPTCGYDLRASPDRCPECGALPPPTP